MDLSRNFGFFFFGDQFTLWSTYFGDQSAINWILVQICQTKFARLSHESFQCIDVHQFVGVSFDKKNYFVIVGRKLIQC